MLQAGADALDVVGEAVGGQLQHEGVENVLVVGNVGVGGEDAELVAAEQAAQAGKQAVAVGHKYHHLQAVSCAQGADVGLGRFGIGSQQGQVP